VARAAGHGGGDYFVIEDFVGAVAGQRPIAIDVYDAVSWSSVYALSAASVQAGGWPQPIPPQPIPDFRARAAHGEGVA
jgi:hypothetical protein